MDTLLVVDVGNTNIVLGIWTGEELVGSWKMATSRERTADEYGVMARQLIEAHGAPRPTHAMVSSVVPPLHSTVKAMIETYFSVVPVFVEPGIRTGLSIKTENPLEVGADRIVNAVAAHELYECPAVIVDFGTATTFDLVSSDGEYRGGLIAPGVLVSADGLFSRAARLPRVELRKPAHLIGTNTVASMQAGLFYGYLSLVDGILSRVRKEVDDVRTVIATGDLAPLICNDSSQIDEVDLELTLKGLRILHERNRERKAKRRS
jgi:type III pantothenate kinase